MVYPPVRGLGKTGRCTSGFGNGKRSVSLHQVGCLNWRMERFLFRRVEVWLVLILAIVGFIAALVFAAYALKTDRRTDLPGPVGQVVLGLAETPLSLVDLLDSRDPRRGLKTAKLEGRSGWRTAEGKDGLADEGYLLLSRYDGSANRAAVELVDLRDLSVRHAWIPDVGALFAGIGLDPLHGERWTREYFEAVHPWLLPDGGLIIKDHYSPLFGLDHCGQKRWANTSLIFHHSTEADAEGTLWIPTHLRPQKEIYPHDFAEDGLTRLSAEGEVLETLSLVDIFVRNGQFATLFGAGAYDPDPLHLNDIQPVLADGPHWKKGDLFLSLRRPSMILLYRPATDRIVWQKQGPWLGQHDIDILDDHRIAIFDNRAYRQGLGPLIDEASETVIYDFANVSLSVPFREAFRRERIETYSEGLQDFTQAGNLIAEEENAGRLVIFAPDGRLIAEFVNRAENGEVYTLGWSRAVTRAQGDAALAAISAAPPC